MYQLLDETIGYIHYFDGIYATYLLLDEYQILVTYFIIIPIEESCSDQILGALHNLYSAYLYQCL